MINTSLFPLTGAFLLGTILGTLTGFHCVSPLSSFGVESGVSLTVLLWLPLLALLLGTSVFGYWILPLLMILRGYMLSASFSFLLSGGFSLRSALVMAGLPALFSVPAFFLLCEEAVSSSRILCLCSVSGLTRRCEYIRPFCLLVIILLLLAAAATQIYLVPQIV